MMHFFQLCGKYLGIIHISKHVNIQEAWGDRQDVI
jgi:hypothetical protein